MHSYLGCNTVLSFHFLPSQTPPIPVTQENPHEASTDKSNPGSPPIFCLVTGYVQWQPPHRHQPLCSLTASCFFIQLTHLDFEDRTVTYVSFIFPAAQPTNFQILDKLDTGNMPKYLFKLYFYNQITTTCCHITCCCL